MTFDTTKNISHQTTGAALLLMVLYTLIVIAPLFIVAVLRPITDHGFVYSVGKNLALVGFTILAMQFVLSARLKWTERPFGLDLLFQFHKVMALVAVTLILSHPLFLIAGGGGWSLILGPETSWHIWLGRIALMILLIHVMLAMFRVVLQLNYQTWRFLHNLGAFVVFPLAFFHSWNAGGDFELPALKMFWLALFASAAGAYLWHRLIRPITLMRCLYTVTEVRQETSDVWTIKFAPPEGSQCFKYQPGQFHFLTLYRAPHLPIEEHHWTISSSPTEQGFISSTIKESGDFTVSIGKTKPGDKALVYGPFGRFSYMLHRHEHNLIFIAGGIGITPLMSMLRHIRDSHADRRVVLLYGNQSEEDILFREELALMESTGVLCLKVVHVLSKPSDNWKGERGYIDLLKIKRLAAANLIENAFYICAPPALMNLVVPELYGCGVPARNIHFERFNL